MKKILFTSAFAFILAISCISCKKDFNCECVAKDVNGTEYNKTVEVINDTKKNAEEQCNKVQQSSGGLTVTCAIVD